jgi:energy-coupling factor transport system permease protein
MNLELYRHGTSFLHRFDPRAKILLLVPLVICFFLPQPWLLLLVYAAAIMMLVAVALGLRDLLLPLKAIGPVLLFICLLTPPFHRDGSVVVRIFGAALLTTGGLRETAVMLLRFLGITLGFFAILRTLPLDDLVLGLRWFRVPYAACLVMIVTLRTIPSLAGTWRNVLDAHRLRSGPMVRHSRRKRIVARYLPLLTSVLIEAVKGIPALAMALESRGFGRLNPRTAYAELKRGEAFFRDMAICLIVAAAFLCPAFVRW